MLRVLTYHRVAPGHDRPWLDPALISASPEDFARQMHYLKTHYSVVPVDAVLDAVAGRKSLPSDAVLITFDDAYADFAEYAWPILQQNKLPVILFVPTAYPDKPFVPFWWDRLHHAVGDLNGLAQYLKRIPHSTAMEIVDDMCERSRAVQPNRPSILDWDQLRRLQRAGVTIASHTRRHPILSQIPEVQVEEEIHGSLRDLRSQVGTSLPIFCYPAGYCSDNAAKVLANEKIELAFSTEPGHNVLEEANLLALRRTNISRRTTLPIFQLRLMRLGGYLDTVRQAA